MKPTTKRSIIIVISAVLICLGSFLSFDTKPVSFSIQGFLVMLVTCTLGGLNAMGAAGLFLASGCVGLPVFFLHRAGFAFLGTEEGGFITGYFLASIVAGLIAGTPFWFERHFSWKYMLRLAGASLAGYIVINLTGTIHYYNYINETKVISVIQAIKDCNQPFFLIQTAEFFVTVILSAGLRPLFAKLMYPEDEF